jgi:hypothetical protein
MALHRKRRAQSSCESLKHSLERNRLRNQLAAAFRAACGKDCTAAFGGHTSAETVRTSAVKLARLESAFHFEILQKGAVLLKTGVDLLAKSYRRAQQKGA